MARKFDGFLRKKSWKVVESRGKSWKVVRSGKYTVNGSKDSERTWPRTLIGNQKASE